MIQTQVTDNQQLGYVFDWQNTKDYDFTQ